MLSVHDFSDCTCYMCCLGWMSWVAGKILGRVVDSIEQGLAEIMCARLVFDEMPHWDFCLKDALISALHTFSQFKQNLWKILDLFSLAPCLFSLLFLLYKSELHTEIGRNEACASFPFFCPEVTRCEVELSGIFCQWRRTKLTIV